RPARLSYGQRRSDFGRSSLRSSWTGRDLGREFDGKIYAQLHDRSDLLDTRSVSIAQRILSALGDIDEFGDCRFGSYRGRFLRKSALGSEHDADAAIDAGRDSRSTLRS